MNPIPLLLLSVACASRSLPIPGPLGPVAHERPPAVHVQDLPRAEPDAPPPASRREDDRFGEAVATAARKHLKALPSGFRNDCSGFVMAAYAKAGHALAGSTRSLWSLARDEGSTTRRPAPGDVAFFDDTYDRNRNGRRDDPLTHVAVVLSIDPDGTITMAHGGTSKGRTLLHMNLEHPGERLGPDGQVWNDWLRARHKGESDRAPRLAGQLFRGFARFRPPAS
jgi:hypothetical protein